ncbi:hypothetical protein Trydic_g11771, partial [Trypoxylus dichotomus]
MLKAWLGTNLQSLVLKVSGMKHVLMILNNVAKMMKKLSIQT